MLWPRTGSQLCIARVRALLNVALKNTNAPIELQRISDQYRYRSIPVMIELVLYFRMLIGEPIKSAC